MRYEVSINGKPAYCRIEEYSRGGTDSPTSFYIWVDGKRLTPYEQRRRNIHICIGARLKMLYADHIKEIIYKDNPLLSRIPKADGFAGAYIPVQLTRK